MVCVRKLAVKLGWFRRGAQECDPRRGPLGGLRKRAFDITTAGIALLVLTSHDLIALSLRVAWSDVVTQPLPDRIRQLLEQLAQVEEARQGQVSGVNKPNAQKRHH